MKLSYLTALLSFFAIAKTATVSFTPTATSVLAERDEKAIVPTTAGQIGVNPVFIDLGGPPETYIGEIQGDDTLYIEIQNITTHWIGVNTEYLSLVTVNPTSTSTVEIVVETATAAVNGSSIGDVSVILPEGVAVGLENAATSAVSSCNVVAAKRRKRDGGTDAMSCVLNIMTDTINGGQSDLFGDVSDAAWEQLGANIAPAADAAVQAAWALMKTKSTQAKFAVLYAAITLATVNAVASKAGDSSDSSVGTVGKINIPAAGVGVPIPKPGCDGSEKLQVNSPLCTDYDCQGTQTNKTCAIEGTENSNCPCLIVWGDPIVQYGNITYLNQQQSLILEISTMTLPPSPYCIPFQDPDNGIKGYCQCSDSKNYDFQTGGSNICPWTTVPPSSDLYKAPTPSITITHADYTSSDYNSGTVWACPTSSVGSSDDFTFTNCEPPSTSIGTFTGNLPLTTSQPPPPPSVTQIMTSTKATTTPCDYAWCGAPFCDPLCGPS